MKFISFLPETGAGSAGGANGSGGGGPGTTARGDGYGATTGKAYTWHLQLVRPCDACD